MILTIGMLEKTMDNIKEHGEEIEKGIFSVSTDKDEIIYDENKGTLVIYEKGGYSIRKQELCGEERLKEVISLLKCMNHYKYNEEITDEDEKYLIRSARTGDIFWTWYQIICLKKGIKGLPNIIGLENDSFWYRIEELKEKNILDLF